MNKVTNDKAAKLVAEYFESALEKKPKWKPDASLLLHPPLPPALHSQNPRSIMGRAKWDVVRKQAYAKHDYRCFACGVAKEEGLGRPVLDAHEFYEFDFGLCELRLKEIVALCVTCHAYIHCNRMHALFDKGIMTPGDCWEILSHGERTLTNQRYESLRMDYPPYMEKDWKKWHLVVDGESYYSKFQDKEEWSEFYQ